MKRDASRCLTPSGSSISASSRSHAGGEAAKPPLVRRNLSERALFRDWRRALLRVEVGDGRHLANEREAGRTVVPKVVVVDHPEVDMLGTGAVDAPELDAAVAEGIVVFVEVDE